MTPTTSIPPDDPLTRAVEGAGHIWVLVLIGVLVVALGVIVLVTGWHRLPSRDGRRRPEHPETP